MEPVTKDFMFALAFLDLSTRTPGLAPSLLAFGIAICLFIKDTLK